MKPIVLPAIIDDTPRLLESLTTSLNIPRSVLAADGDIKHAWNTLPLILPNIPEESRHELLARMCISIATGLFDSAINYAWNTAVIALRDKIKNFGLHIVPQITGKDFDETKLLDLTDADLLDLCLKLNLIDEDGFFFLDQCREIRNNFSAAHPSMGPIDAHELINFINRCAKYALLSVTNPKGVETNFFITSLKANKFTDEQLAEWVSRIQNTHQVQRDMLIEMVHGIYCDETSTETTRTNCLNISLKLRENITPKCKSNLVDRHSDYIAKGDEKRRKASIQFFEKLGMVAFLNESERHLIITGCCEQLYNVHLAFNNFYNEPPFAQRLFELSKQSNIPDSAKVVYVETVMTCAIGNQYGTSNAAYPYYRNMVLNFSPSEIIYMFELLEKNNRFSIRVKNHRRCKLAFIALVKLLEPSSVPTKVKTTYESIVS